MIIKKVTTKNYATKSNLPASDYVINPYIGCSHACKYCYARFMKRFTRHTEEWGDFIDVKMAETPLNKKQLMGKTIFIASVTDPYNPYEEQYEITRNILKELMGVNCEIHITTKSKLILRDIDIIKKLKKVKVAISINTLDETFKDDMDKASSIKERIETLKKLHEANISTVLFMSPIFPYITNWQEIIEKTKNVVDEYWFENLNLRDSYKENILAYIKEKYSSLYSKYCEIYLDHDEHFWIELSKEIEDYCLKNKIAYQNFFNHKELVAEKKAKEKIHEV